MIVLVVRNPAVRDAERAVVYAGTNALRVELKNAGDRALALTPGTSAVDLAFTRFGGDQNEMTVAPGDRRWSVQRASSTTWRLVPGESVTLDAGAAVVFAVDALEVKGDPGLAHVVASCRNFEGWSGNAAADVIVQRDPPEPGRRGDKPFGDFSWVGAPEGQGDIVYITPGGAEPIENTLVLELGNPRPVAAKANAGPEFFLSFILADDEVTAATAPALTTLKYAAGVLNDGHPITVEADDPDWRPASIPDFNDRDARHVWTFKPPSLLARNQSVRLTISNVRLPNAQPGQPSFDPKRTTYVFLQYVVPGYDEGFYFLPIRKVAPQPAIRRFTVDTQGTIDPGDPVTFSWDTCGASRVALRIESGIGSEFATDSKDASLRIERIQPAFTPKPFLIEEETAYLLEAFGITGERVAERRTIRRRQPRIHTFEVASRAMLGEPIALRWKTENVSSCRLADSSGVLGRVGGVTVPVDAQDYRVHAPVTRMTYELFATLGELTITRKLPVQVETMFPQSFPLPPFPIDDKMLPVLAANDAEWAGQIGLPGGRVTCGRFDRAAGCVESASPGLSLQEELVRVVGRAVADPVPHYRGVSYLAVFGAGAADVEAVMAPSSGGRRYLGWTGKGWSIEPAVSFGGYYWYRYEIRWPRTQGERTLSIATVRGGRGRRPFKVWGFTWNK